MYLKMALGQAFLCSPKLWHLKFSVLGLWSPAIRGGNWARVCGQNRLEALRPGHSAGPSLCLPWQSGRLTHYNRVNCFIFLLNTNGPVPHRPFLKANAFLGTLKNHSREEAIVDQNQGWPGTLTCNHRESRALSKDKLPASWFPQWSPPRQKPWMTGLSVFPGSFFLLIVFPGRNIQKSLHSTTGFVFP